MILTYSNFFEVNLREGYTAEDPRRLVAVDAVLWIEPWKDGCCLSLADGAVLTVRESYEEVVHALTVGPE